MIQSIHDWAARCEALDLQSPILGHVYNPLDYAWAGHLQYLQRFGSPRPKRVFMLGINPGPWGMTQTGVPFGDVQMVRDWMGIQAPIGQPSRPHPKRPVKGFELTRREGSGKRLWGWAAQRFGQADDFFEHAFVWAYCPLLFLKHPGAQNLTPDKLTRSDRDRLYPLCDAMLRQMLDWMRPSFAVGIGAFATTCLQKLSTPEDPWSICRITHPSPANPQANHDWGATIEAQCLEAGLDWAALARSGA